MKVLIYYNECDLKPVGGPSGYLYNLSEELKKRKINSIEFLPEKKLTVKEQLIKNLKDKYQKIIPAKLKLKLGLYEKMMYKRVFGNIKRESYVDLNKYDAIHFHSALSMYMIKDSLENYKGKVILTSHSPKVSYKEILDNMISIEKYNSNKEKYDQFDIIDEFAFNRADYIHFPAKEAEECYYNTWDKYGEIHKKNIEKYYYIPTGINPVKVYLAKNDVRKNYNIPEDAFVISYVGRHNEIKGYRHLKEIGKKVLENDATQKIYFLIGGKEEPIEGLKNSRWIEVGWTNKPHDLINASDLFILPNKETYFDLIMLEVLSTGKMMLVTNTGGNKYFKMHNSPGILYYDYGNTEQAIEKINNLLSVDTEKNGLINKELMNEFYTISVFTDKYLAMLDSILKGEK